MSLTDVRGRPIAPGGGRQIATKADERATQTLLHRHPRMLWESATSPLICPPVSRITTQSRRWRSRLGPLLEAWDKMASSITGSPSSSSAAAGRGGGNPSGRRASRRLSGASGGAEGRQVPPVDAFVAMENEAAVDLCEIVSASLGSVKKVRGHGFAR